MTSSEMKRRSIQEFWRRAQYELGVRVVVPFAFEVEGRRHECSALVPDFGSPVGIALVGFEPGATIHAELEASLKKLGQPYSLLNVDVYAEYSATLAMETLEDWGYFGTDNQRPPWFGRSRTDPPRIGGNGVGEEEA